MNGPFPQSLLSKTPVVKVVWSSMWSKSPSQTFSLTTVLATHVNYFEHGGCR